MRYCQSEERLYQKVVDSAHYYRLKIESVTKELSILTNGGRDEYTGVEK